MQTKMNMHVNYYNLIKLKKRNSVKVWYVLYTLKSWKYSVSPIYIKPKRLLCFSFIELSMNCTTILAYKSLIYRYTRKTKSTTFPMYMYSQYLHVHGNVSCSLKQRLRCSSSTVLMRWLTAAKYAKVSWLLNFRVCMFLKSTVSAIIYVLHMMILVSNMQFLKGLPLVKCTRVLAMANLVYQSNTRRQFDIISRK